MYTHRRIRKNFQGQIYEGNVTQYDEKKKWYEIIYEDGDK